MSKKNDNSKIVIEKFITPKQLGKIDDLLAKKKSVHDTCDKLEKIFEDSDFKPFDAGTNRYVFVHKKMDDIVFKIAADQHGINANYRELYLSDIDRRLTRTYSISDSGTVLVAEKVKRFKNPQEAQQWRKEILKMLWKLHKKILLVDCKLSNFKNFGLRKTDDGTEPVLLDFGDTVPYEHLQSFDTEVDFEEEINVSLRCRNVVGSMGKGKQCKGILVPNDDFSALICDTCGQAHSFHQAYSAFILDELNKKKQKGSNFVEGIDEDKFKEIEKEMANTEKTYSLNKMKEAKEMNNDEYQLQLVEYKTMKPEYIIVGDYVIPPSPAKIKFSAMKYGSVVSGKIKPEEYLEFIGENPDEWNKLAFGIGAELKPVKNLTDKFKETSKKYANAVDVDSKARKIIPAVPGKNSIATGISPDTFYDNIPRGVRNTDVNTAGTTVNSNVQTTPKAEPVKPQNTILDNPTKEVDYSAELAALNIDRDDYLDDNKLMDMIDTIGKKLDPASMNLLSILNETPATDADMFKSCNGSPIAHIKLYNILIEVMLTVRGRDTITTAMSILSDLADKVQEITWSSMYKSYRMSKISRYHIRLAFIKAWNGMISQLISHISHSDITIDEIVRMGDDYGINISLDDIRAILGFWQTGETSDGNDEKDNVEGLITSADVGELTVTGGFVASETYTINTNVQNQYQADDAISEIINAFGEDVFIRALGDNEQFKNIVDKLQYTRPTPKITDLATEDGVIPVTLSSLKDTSIAVAWKEPGDKVSTIVKVDLYQHILKNSAYLKPANTNIMTVADIQPWDGEFVDYDKLYREIEE